MELDKFLQIIYLCIGCLGILFGFVSTFKSLKGKTILQKLKTLTPQLNYLITLIKKAESFTHYTGSEKLTYVLTQYQLYCLNNKITFDETKVTEQVEELITLTKEVNTGNNIVGVDDL